MIIRSEEIKDKQEIYDLVKSAFQQAEHSDGNEHDLVDALRTSNAYIPTLSLVAEQDGEIVGHIMFTKVEIQGHIELALAPLAVAPHYQKQGIGSSLIKEGHKRAAELGYNYSIVLGSERYYPQMGYVPAAVYGIKPPFEVPSENFMAYPLTKEVLAIEGTVQYAKEFGID